MIFMKKILTASLLVLSACNVTNIPQKKNVDDLIIAQNYVPGTEDVPIYNGFKPVNKNNLAYDSESGRIVDASYFSNKASIKDVNNYYSETLPELGWKRKAPSDYIRDGEKLKITVTSKEGITYLKFVIRPAH